MRKLFWCCSAAAALALGSLFAASYYAYRQPDSAIGRCITTAANASIAMQPVAGLVTMAAQVGHRVGDSPETADMANASEECIPDEPRPIAPEPSEIVLEEKSVGDLELETAPIVIREEEPMPREFAESIIPATIELSAVPNGPDNVCPMVMPYCSDDDEQSTVKLVMPYVEDDGKKAATTDEDSENSDFKAWKKLFEEAGQAGKVKDAPPEELPPPTEEPSSEPKCQEDSHIHEHYSGCPRTTCPYTGKSYPLHDSATKSGMEESSEEPPRHHRSLKRSEKSRNIRPRTEGVDTMEYRPSDGGLNEYGRGPL